jgi:hypothetical protein
MVVIFAFALLSTLPAAADGARPGPHVTRMHLTKGTHTLTLYDGEQVVAGFGLEIRAIRGGLDSHENPFSPPACVRGNGEENRETSSPEGVPRAGE